MYNHETKVFVYVVNACKLIVTNFKSPRKFPLLSAYRITLRVSSKQLAMPNYVHNDKVYGIIYISTYYAGCFGLSCYKISWHILVIPPKL